MRLNVLQASLLALIALFTVALLGCGDGWASYGTMGSGAGNFRYPSNILIF